MSCDLITGVIVEVVDKHYQNHQIYQQKLQLCQKLFDELRNALEDHFDLFIVGSTQSQFALKCSDLDLCLVIYDAAGNVNNDYLLDNNLTIAKLIKIKDIVVAKEMCSKLELFHPAAVPIFRFTDKTHQITVDLNINRIVTIRNSFLLTCYNYLDKRVTPLVVAVKSWAVRSGINSSFHGTLSSYSLTLMVIHFLQQVHVLPHLQAILGDDYFLQMRSTSNMAKSVSYVQKKVFAVFRPLNYRSLGQLFADFIYYYCQPGIFRNVISIHPFIDINQLAPPFVPRGRPLPMNYHDRPFITIEDPFERKNTAYSVYTEFHFNLIVQAFKSMKQSIINQTICSAQFDY